MNTLNRFSAYAHWLLRVALGSVFLYHGLTKFPALQGMADMMGMPVIMVGLIAIMETVGGALILIGGFGPDWATRLGGLLIAPVMLGAISMVHWGQWSFQVTESHPMGGMEFQTTLLLLAFYFLLAGNSTSGGARPRPPARSQRRRLHARTPQRSECSVGRSTFA